MSGSVKARSSGLGRERRWRRPRELKKSPFMRGTKKKAKNRHVSFGKEPFRASDGSLLFSASEREWERERGEGQSPGLGLGVGLRSFVDDNPQVISWLG